MQIKQRYVETLSSLSSAESQLAEAKRDLTSEATTSNSLESDLKIEKEWRLRLQETSKTDAENLASLREELEQLHVMKQVMHKFIVIDQPVLGRMGGQYIHAWCSFDRPGKKIILQRMNKTRYNEYYIGPGGSLNLPDLFVIF